MRSMKEKSEILERPGVHQFLNKLKKYYEIIVFTAGSKDYAELVRSILDPKREIFNYILSHESCLKTRNGLVVKNLEILKGRNLRDIIIVDNLAQNFGLHVNNGIPILSWYGDKSDNELSYICDYLIAASYADDVREYNKKKLNLAKLIDHDLESLGLA